jgi:ATP-dependent helicase HrpB
VASAGHEPGPARGNLAQAGAQLLTNSSRWPQDVRETFKRLNFGESKQSEPEEEDGLKTEKLVAKIWARAFPKRMACLKEGFRYRLGDGRMVSLRGPEGVSGWTEMVVAVNLAETGGAGRSKRLNCGLWVPSRLEWMLEAFPGSFQQERKFYWDAKKARVSAFEEISFKGSLLKRKEIQVSTSSPETESLLVEKLLEGEMTLPQWDEKFHQLWNRFRLLSRAYPEYGFPKLNGEDKALFLHCVCEKQTSLSGLRKVALRPVLQQYMGEMASAMLGMAVPEHKKLPGGRRGRYTYFSTEMPELSARIGDFIGMEGEHRICEGRIKVLYNILAPNFRTVQKTDNISRFWKKTYPEVRKELKRRYPKHPWPE